MSSFQFRNRLQQAIVIVVIFALTISTQVSGYSSASVTYHMSIMNKLPDANSVLDSSCWVHKPNDGDPKHIPVGGSFNWSFHSTPFYHKHYTCKLIWMMNGVEQGIRQFQAFADHKGFVDDQCGGRHCIWKAAAGGIYLYYIPYDVFLFKYGWQIWSGNNVHSRNSTGSNLGRN